MLTEKAEHPVKYWRKALDLDGIKQPRYQVHFLKDRCKGCRICIEFCPRQGLHESTEINRKGYHPACMNGENVCLGCGLCEMICPEFAISVTEIKENSPE